MVQIRLFGGVSAATNDGEPVDIGPAKCQAVLAALALSAGSAVPVSRLVGLVWGEEPPRTAERTLQSYVTRLRKGLGRASIVRIGAAYRLDVEADAVDIARFRRQLDVGDIEAALAEWTGTPLAGLDAEGLAATVAGLVEQWLGAVEIDLGRRIETDTPAAIGSLTELTANYPFREGLWALLMTALYRVGRQADALATYGKARQHLVEELGVEPGPRLRELESLILDHDEQLSVDRSSKGSGSGLPTGTVTFGFSDVEDSTRSWPLHRQETAAARARHDELIRAAVADHGGHIFATGGDSFGVAFHRAGDAGAWATELQAAMSSERWPGGVEMRPRIGLHTGETEERGSDYYGPAVNVALRIAAAAHGGQTLVSGATSSLLEGSDLSDLGTFRLDGVLAEHRILQLGNGEHPPLRAEGNGRGNLPRRLGRLIGRDEDLEIVDEAFTTAPVVTLVGPGGIGKARLALAAARRAAVDLAGGAWLIELAEIASSNDVPRAVADTLDVKGSPSRTLTQSIVTVFQSRQALLVLDNCEHVVDGAAELARAVVEGCSNVRVLATSREGLGLATEQLITVAPLDPAGSAVELFNERALAADRTFEPQSSRDAVQEICRRLEGVPLAIELAAARTRALSATDLVERLDDHLRLLTGGRRSSAERHQTLRATIQWSYELLTPPEQRLFHRLSIFAGPFDLTAAEAVAADTDLDALDVDDTLGGLVARSMLLVESGPFGRRFRLLETMRQFGAEHLSESGDSDLMAGRHARWCLDRVTDIHQLLAGQGEIEGVARLAELWANLRAAVHWACATPDRQLAHALVHPVAQEVVLRNQSEIGDWAERILAITPADDEELIVFGLIWAGRRYMRHQDHEAYERLVARYGEPGHPMIRYARAFLYSDYEARAELAPKAVAALRRQGEDYFADVFEVVGIGLTLLTTGRLEEHDAVVTALADRYRAQGPPTCLNWALIYLGVSAWYQGKHGQVEQLFDDALSVDIPDRTRSWNTPLKARAAFRRGNRSSAYQILRSYVDELLDVEAMSDAKLLCLDFIEMMAKIDRLQDAARILGYLEATGFLDAPAFRAQVAEVAGLIAAQSEHSPDEERATGRDLDDRHALAYMGDVFDELLADGQQMTN